MKLFYIVFLIALTGCSCFSKRKSQVTSKPSSNVKSDVTPSYQSLSKLDNDTLKYVHVNFLENKQPFVEKELNVLLSKLEIPVKSFLLTDDVTMRFNPAILIEFYTKKEKNARIKEKKNPVIVSISWETPLPIDSVVALIRKNKGNWTVDEQRYFGKQTVKNIDIVKYDF